MGDEAHQHLRKYVSEGCEIAFAALVQKHAGMVFGTAFRRTGDREAAEEISQNVFTILARKAQSLRGDGSLGGWLHRTTLLETKNFLHQQKRIREKMQALNEHELSQSEESLAAQQALPVLDEAINKLPPGDRRLILLRFFEGLSIREIAVATGKSEAASQKQSQRALQKLSDLLKRRGVAVPAAVLASQLIPETSTAATVELAASLSKTALAGASSITTTQLVTNTILTMTYSKTILATATGLSLAAATVVPMTLMGSPDDEKKKPTPSSTAKTPADSDGATQRTRTILPPAGGAPPPSRDPFGGGAGAGAGGAGAGATAAIAEDPFGGATTGSRSVSVRSRDKTAYINALKRRSTEVFSPLMKELKIPEAKQKQFIQLEATRQAALADATGNKTRRDQLNREFDGMVTKLLGAEVLTRINAFRDEKRAAAPAEKVGIIEPKK